MRQLKGYSIEQLRSLVPPEPGKVQSMNGKGFTDGRVGPEQWGDHLKVTMNSLTFSIMKKLRKFANPYSDVQAPSICYQGTHMADCIRTYMVIWDLTIFSGIMKRAEIAAVIDLGRFPEY